MRKSPLVDSLFWKLLDDTTLSPNVATQFSSFMLGISARGLVEWFSIAHQLSWSLTCPVYCGPSHWPWLLAGFSCGFLTCLVVLLTSCPLASRITAKSCMRPLPQPDEVRRLVAGHDPFLCHILWHGVHVQPHIV